MLAQEHSKYLCIIITCLYISETARSRRTPGRRREAKCVVLVEALVLPGAPDPVHEPPLSAGNFLAAPLKNPRGPPGGRGPQVEKR